MPIDSARIGLRSQFHHVIDVAPTILEVAGIPEPREVNRVPLPPIEGISMAYTFGDEAAPGRRITQYFEMLGNRALYHDGWVAGCLHGRLPWLSGRAPSIPSTCSVRRGHAADGVVVLVGRFERNGRASRCTRGPAEQLARVHGAQFGVVQAERVVVVRAGRLAQ